MTPLFMKAGNVAALRRWVGRVGFTEALKHVAKRFGSERAKRIVGKLKGQANQRGELAPEHAYGATTTKATMAEWLTAKPMDFGTRADTITTAPTKPMQPTLKAAGGGPGSRGGKVVGTTQSGKPIYDRFEHPAHQGFSEADHQDAAQALRGHADLTSLTSGTRTPGRTGDLLRQSLKHSGQARKASLDREPAPKALPEAHSRYFHITTGTQHIPLDKLHGTKGPQPQSEERAAKLMARAGAGKGTRRMPITVRPHPKKAGHFQVVDGNATHGAAKRFGWSSLPAVMAKAWRPGMLLKARARGEGARGGRIIGHTRSGKPIYDRPEHPAHAGFSRMEHHEASEAHKDAAAELGAPRTQRQRAWIAEHGKHAEAHQRAGLEAAEAATLSPTHEHFKERTAGFARDQHHEAIEHHHARVHGKPMNAREHAHAAQRDWHQQALPPDEFRPYPVSQMKEGDTYRHYTHGTNEQEHHRITRVEHQPYTGMRTLHTEHGQKILDDHQRTGDDPLLEVQPGAGAMAKGAAMKLCTKCNKAVVGPGKHCTNCGANLMLKDGPAPAEASERRELASHANARDRLRMPPEKNPVPGAHYEPDQDQVGGPLDGDDDDARLMRKGETGWWQAGGAPAAKIRAAARAKGEGSRGGKVVGHTRAGKAVYDRPDHPAHGSFTPADHLQAAALHSRAGRYAQAQEHTHYANAARHRSRQSAPASPPDKPEAAIATQRAGRTDRLGVTSGYAGPRARVEKGEEGGTGYQPVHHPRHGFYHAEKMSEPGPTGALKHPDGRARSFQSEGEARAAIREHHGMTKARRPKLGSGKRFAELKGKLARRPGVRDPRALAAHIGRKKYGKKRFAQLAKAAPAEHTFGPPGTCAACTAAEG